MVTGVECTWRAIHSFSLNSRLNHTRRSSELGISASTRVAASSYALTSNLKVFLGSAPELRSQPRCARQHTRPRIRSSRSQCAFSRDDGMDGVRAGAESMNANRSSGICTPICRVRATTACHKLDHESICPARTDSEMPQGEDPKAISEERHGRWTREDLGSPWASRHAQGWLTANTLPRAPHVATQRRTSSASSPSHSLPAADCHSDTRDTGSEAGSGS